MCGRFTLSQDEKALYDSFHVKANFTIKPRYNIAPTQNVLALSENEDSIKKFIYLHWGLIPPWSKNSSFCSKLINARSETLFEKASFKDAIKKRRCLIIADGYYEWEKTDGQKQPYYFKRPDSKPFGFAGIWEQWINPKNNEIIKSCSIITAESNNSLKSIHHRMPVIIPFNYYDDWLSKQNKDFKIINELLSKSLENDLTFFKVSSLVNSIKNDSKNCCEIYNQNKFNF